MNQDKIDRINTLYHKSKATGLSEEEKAEQAALRKEYIESHPQQFTWKFKQHFHSGG